MSYDHSFRHYHSPTSLSTESYHHDVDHGHHISTVAHSSSSSHGYHHQHYADHHPHHITSSAASRAQAAFPGTTAVPVLALFPSSAVPAAAATAAPPPAQPPAAPPLLLASPPPHSFGKRCKLVAAVVGGAATIAAIILIMWAVYLPMDPKFRLHDVAVDAFNVTGSNTVLNAALRVTITSRNPSGHVGIEYDQLQAWVAYRGQKVTQTVDMPAGYLGKKDQVDWSPVLQGEGEGTILPLDMSTVLGQDLNAGAVMLNLKVVGKLRRKIMTGFTHKRRLDVDCPVYVGPGGDRAVGKGIGGLINGGRGVEDNQGCRVVVN